MSFLIASGFWIFSATLSIVLITAFIAWGKRKLPDGVFFI